MDNNNKIRMTTSLKTKLKKSQDQTNNDKYRVAANITEYHTDVTVLIIELPRFLQGTLLLKE